MAGFVCGRHCGPCRRGGDFLALAGKQLGEGQAGTVIDGDVQVLPTGATAHGAAIALTGPVTGDAVAHAVDAAKLLDVDVDELA